jgi:hypothetical protein
MRRWWQNSSREAKIGLLSLVVALLALPPAWLALDGSDNPSSTSADRGVPVLDSSGSQPAVNPSSAAATQNESSAAASPKANAQGDVRHYLDEMSTSQHKGCGSPRSGSFLVGSKEYSRSVAIVAEICSGGGPNYVEYAVDPAYECTSFSTVLGVPNSDNEKARASMSVSIDGRLVKPAATLIRSKTVDVQSTIQSTSIIRLQMENTASDAGFLSVTGVFGDAHLDCAA